MKKILVGYIIDGKHSGIDKYLLNFLENVHNEDIQIDFLTTKKEKDVEELLKNYNSKLIEVPRLVHPIKKYRALKKIYKTEKYDIAYLNISESFNCISAIAAKHSKVEKVVIHSHSSGSSKKSKIKRNIFKFLNYIFRGILYHYGDLFLACSKEAGEWIYPKKILKSDRFKIIYNTVDFEKFKFNPEVRERIRKEEKLEGKVVIGHIGNFAYQKNHKFIIELFSNLSKDTDKYHLLLIGIGEDFEEIKNLVKNLNIENKVTFVGLVNNVYEYLQAMDIFILPSKFEGLPIARHRSTSIRTSNTP